MSEIFHVIVCYLLVVSSNEAARILGVFPFPSISHQVVFQQIIQELAKRGHEVIVITTDPVFSSDEAPANLTEIDVHDISYKIWRETVMTTSKGNENDFEEQLQTYLNAMNMIFDAQLRNKQVNELLEDTNQKFDLILVEALVRPALVFSHKYKAPLIQVSSFGGSFDNYPTIGAPGHPFLYPTITRQRLNNLSWWEKIYELYNTYKLESIFESNKQSEHEVLKKHFGNSVPSIDELNNNVDMLFLNIHPLFEGIRPVPPTVVYMGGLHEKPDKELPSDLKSYLDSSRNGVIYISFGTNVDPSLLPAHKIQTLVNAFSKLPYDVLWKWNNDELPRRTKNIKILKWLPQSDLLKHPKIKLFITQGGLQSTDEAITAGVPLIGMPMLGDQWFNVERYEYHKIGIRLDMDKLTDVNLIKIIDTIIGDDSDEYNFVKICRTMANRIYAGTYTFTTRSVAHDRYTVPRVHNYYGDRTLKKQLPYQLNSLPLDIREETDKVIFKRKLKNYRRNIVRLREYMRDEPMRPLDRAVWWTEYVLRHGGAKHLRSPAANISWAQYLELELVFNILMILFIITALLVTALRFIYFTLDNCFTVKVKSV